VHLAPGDASGQEAGGESARLEDDNFPVAEQPVVEQHLRNLGRFSRAGRCLQDQTGSFAF
jgi:hypothetical protein